MAQDVIRAPRHHHAAAALAAKEAQTQEGQGDAQQQAQSAVEQKPVTQPEQHTPEVPAATTPAAREEGKSEEHAARELGDILLGLTPAKDEIEDEPPVKKDTGIDPDLARDLEELRRENNELKNRMAETDNLTKAQREELEQLRRATVEREAEELLSLSGVELENLDPDAARELTDKILRPAIQRMRGTFDQDLTQMASKLEESTRSIEKMRSETSEREKKSQLARINSAITTAHPDFPKLMESREFKRFLRSTVAGSSITLGEIVSREYNAGNADFVVDVVSKFKGDRPSLDSIASAPASGTGTTPASNEPEAPTYTAQDVADWNRQFATGKLSRTQYRENMQKYREAQSNSRQVS